MGAVDRHRSTHVATLKAALGPLPLRLPEAHRNGHRTLTVPEIHPKPRI
jgi:hypothetical protein